MVPSPARVAIVSDYYLDYVGGAQTSMLQQKAALAEAGHHVVLVASVRKGAEHPAVDLAIAPWWSVPGLELPVSSATRRLIDRLKAYFTAEAIDVVHVQTEFGLAHAAVTAAHELGIPAVHTVHTFYWQSTGAAPNLAAPAMRALLQRFTRARFPHLSLSPRAADNVLRNLTAAMALRADTVISPSAHQARDLADAGVTAPIAVIANPIVAGPVAPALLAEDAPARFVWIARCEPEKRPLVFAEAAIAAVQHAPIEVDFVGEGSQLDDLRSLVAGTPQIRVHGSLPHAEVTRLIDASSMVALTSFGFDNQPMTIAEAVARYRGVLLCDPNLSDGLAHAGHLTPDPSAASLADALVHLATTPGAMRALSEGAERDAWTFGPEAYVEQVRTAYSNARAVRDAAAPR